MPILFIPFFSLVTPERLFRTVSAESHGSIEEKADDEYWPHGERHRRLFGRRPQLHVGPTFLFFLFGSFGPREESVAVTELTLAHRYEVLPLTKETLKAGLGDVRTGFIGQLMNKVPRKPFF